MTKKLMIPLVLLIVLVTIGAKEATTSSKIVEVGSSYLISNGSAAVKGKVVADLGNGWYSVLRADGGGVDSVNIAQSFFIREQK